MKTTQSSGTRPVHQTVAGPLEFKSKGKAIAIEFTEQRLSPHAGSATFWVWLRRLDWTRGLGAALPHPQPRSNNKLLPLEKALAFMHGLLCDARKLTHVAYLRRDPLAPELLGNKRIASQSALTRFFQGFGSAGDPTVVAAGQRALRWQRHGFLFGFVGEPAAPSAAARCAR